MIWCYFGKENNSSRKVILKIELELNKPKLNLVTVGRDFSFPCIFMCVVFNLMCGQCDRTSLYVGTLTPAHFL